MYLGLASTVFQASGRGTKKAQDASLGPFFIQGRGRTVTPTSVTRHLNTSTMLQASDRSAGFGNRRFLDLEFRSQLSYPASVQFTHIAGQCQALHDVSFDATRGKSQTHCTYAKPPNRLTFQRTLKQINSISSRLEQPTTTTKWIAEKRAREEKFLKY